MERTVGPGVWGTPQLAHDTYGPLELGKEAEPTPRGSPNPQQLWRVVLHSAPTPGAPRLQGRI